MYPILLDFEIGGLHLTLYAYSTALILATVTAGVLLPIQWCKCGMKRHHVAVLIAFMGLLGVVGARLMYSLIYLEETLEAPRSIFDISLTGFTLYGGLFACFIGMIFLTKIWRLPLRRIMDASIPVLTICLVISRLGCLLNGCCYGKETNLPWGLPINKGSIAYITKFKQNPFFFFGDKVHVHPTQVYEILVVIFSYCIARWIYKKWDHLDGFLALPFGGLLSAGRFIVFFYRDFPVATLGANIVRGPIIYGGCMVICMIWMITILQSTWGKEIQK